MTIMILIPALFSIELSSDVRFREQTHFSWTPLPVIRPDKMNHPYIRRDHSNVWVRGPRSTGKQGPDPS
jgi:hypothetical protein